MALVLTDLTDGVATITLNDPDRLNALSLPLVEEALAVPDVPTMVMEVQEMPLAVVAVVAVPKV